MSPDLAPRWAVDRLAWARHRLSCWCFVHLREWASPCMMALLVAPPWVLFLGWSAWLISVSFDGPHISLGRFVVMTVGIALPYEALARWWRCLNAPLGLLEGGRLGELLLRNVDATRWKRDPILGVRSPCLRLEKWMVLWAFEESSVRDAVAGRLRSASEIPQGEGRPRRL